MNNSDFFEDVLKRPALYIGCKSVSRLKAFMDGYMFGLDPNEPNTENFNGPFNEWVAKRFRITTAHSWASIIVFMNIGDENAAFDMTKELWEEYKTESSFS